ncbi:LysR family transcriptional regulator [Octadecabacter sp. CECT 8868]|uniref:LysR family transcriptional regulator n=1 Tax=Octadecabacter algicola TaxID=2909342 RepID=UPI001F18E130|nr:LysR family transcriptional regulator [Octadecabacter algicola]MCF2904606.1 LysR family transcriptional regulator [Octadecabacter algicola]
MAFKNEISFDDLALLLAVVEAGNLTSAGQRMGIPLPTVSRRMRHLETELGRTLLDRNGPSVTLTEDGRSLADEITSLNEVRNRLRRWRDNTDPAPLVRITSGTWTLTHLAKHLPNRPDWRPAFLDTINHLDLARREADIGIRNAPPDHPWLARQKVRPVEFAIYGTDPSVKGYIAPAPSDHAGSSQRWLLRHYSDQIVATASTPQIAYELANTGFGRAILPTFIGDPSETMVRLSDPIPQLSHSQWIVAHQDARQDPAIRAAIDVIAEILSL